jgi:hypothetical protein
MERKRKSKRKISNYKLRKQTVNNSNNIYKKNREMNSKSNKNMLQFKKTKITKSLKRNGGGSNNRNINEKKNEVRVSSFAHKQHEKKPVTLTPEDKKCVPMLNGTQLGPLLGEGVYKTVYAKCDTNNSNNDNKIIIDNCNENVLLIVPFEETRGKNEEDKRNRTEQKKQKILREIQKNNFIFNADIKREVIPLTKPIALIGVCDKTKKIFFEQKRMMGTLRDIGYRQFLEIKKAFNPKMQNIFLNENGILVFTKKQLRDAVLLAHILFERHNVIHGDLHADNILVDSQGNFILSDFGFAGVNNKAEQSFTQGFECNFSGPNTLPLVPKEPELLAVFNIFQLEIDLSANGFLTLVIRDDDTVNQFITKSQNNGVFMFQQFDNFNTLNLFQNYDPWNNVTSNVRNRSVPALDDVARLYMYCDRYPRLLKNVTDKYLIIKTIIITLFDGKRNNNVPTILESAKIMGALSDHSNKFNVMEIFQNNDLWQKFFRLALIDDLQRTLNRDILLVPFL